MEINLDGTGDYLLTTDGYVFLRIDDPVCAWNTYRGVLASANVITRHRGCLSVWVLASIRQGAQSSRIARECRLEKIRRTHYRDRVSRSWGIYCFLKKEFADRAPRELAQPYMTSQNMAEINLSEARHTSTHDLNWITYRSGEADPSWIHAYWNGDPCPGHVPLWETLVEGRVIVLGTELRERAYQMIKEGYPDSMGLLEIARIAAWIGSDLGAIAAFIVSKGHDFALDYYMNMEEAESPTLLKKICDYMQSGQPVNRNDIAPFLRNETFGSVPDLRRFSLIKPKVEMSFLEELL